MAMTQRLIEDQQSGPDQGRAGADLHARLHSVDNLPGGLSDRIRAADATRASRADAQELLEWGEAHHLEAGEVLSMPFDGETPSAHQIKCKKGEAVVLFPPSDISASSIVNCAEDAESIDIQLPGGPVSIITPSEGIVRQEVRQAGDQFSFIVKLSRLSPTQVQVDLMRTFAIDGSVSSPVRLPSVRGVEVIAGSQGFDYQLKSAPLFQ